MLRVPSTDTKRLDSLSKLIISRLVNHFLSSSGILTDVNLPFHHCSQSILTPHTVTADDMVGKVEISLHDLILNPGVMHQQISTLTGVESGSRMPGELHWEVGYFGKAELRPALRTSGKDVNLPAGLRDRPDLQDDQGVLENALEDAVMHTPPDPLWPSGIASLVVHQIVNLETRSLKGNYGSRKNGKEYSPGMETGEIKQEEGGKLPSAYCTIALNDQLVRPLLQLVLDISS